MRMVNHWLTTKMATD